MTSSRFSSLEEEIHHDEDKRHRNKGSVVDEERWKEAQACRRKRSEAEAMQQHAQESS